MVVVDDEERTLHGGLWRLFAANDGSIDRFLCRDCDSRLNCQERVAVDDWIRSGSLFHIMRDHVWHNELILVGLWGGVAGALPDLKSIALDGPRFRSDRWMDQHLLCGVVWPLIREDHLAHDSTYRLGHSVEFPNYGRFAPHLHVGGAVTGERLVREWRPRAAASPVRPQTAD